MEIMRWCLPAQKTEFQLRILNVLGKPHIGFWALKPFTSDKNFLGLQGNIVSHYI